jgi:prepilin-type N-terminal cleavage/methylation domain-containing protein/prepilin-type processing-associated H-X9-DG protein
MNISIFPVRRRGFTLIELLVVIGIIGLLIAILLPVLRKARESANQVVCLSNMRQITIAFFGYGIDNNGIIPGTFYEGPIDLDWVGRNNATYLANPSAYSHPLLTSVLNPYLRGSDQVLSCPTGMRLNGYSDYTMVIRFAGAKIGLHGRMSYPIHPDLSNSPRAYFDAIPFLVEESQYYYNASTSTGSFPNPTNDLSFANVDQFSHRHSGKCNIACLDGSVEAFQAPEGPLGETVAEQQDLTCNNLLFESLNGNFIVSHSDPTEFGWANNPVINPTFGQ